MAKTVFVGLSGGVDSSVAALRLKNQGYDVVGVFIKVWHPDWLVCNWEAERLDAMRVAAHLGIPFLTCNAEAAYRDEVASYFIESYKAGLTPNPDVLCNQKVKFGAFLEFAKDHKADHIATGHYVTKNNQGALCRGIDSNKDQSYFLWSLTPEQLKIALFPVGDTTKEKIRGEAAAAQLPTALKRDSQGVCFLGHIEIKEFLSHYTELTPGPVCTRSGEVIGQHEGALIYTRGQRHGFTVQVKTRDNSPWYVVDKDLATNIVVVDTKPATTLPAAVLTLHNVVWRGTLPVVGQTISFQTRYRQTPVSGVITADNSDVLNLQPIDRIELPAAGQSCVLYDGEVCLGGGIIS